MDCIFCKIARREIPSAIVYEDQYALAFLDINPVAYGHALVIPKNHYETISDIPEAKMAELAKAVRRVASAVMKATGAHGLNVMQNNGRAAEQLVPHMHFHIIPRFEDDGLMSKWPVKKYLGDEMEATRKKIAEWM